MRNHRNAWFELPPQQEVCGDKQSYISTACKPDCPQPCQGQSDDAGLAHMRIEETTCERDKGHEGDHTSRLGSWPQFKLWAVDHVLASGKVALRPIDPEIAMRRFGS